MSRFQEDILQDIVHQVLELVSDTGVADGNPRVSVEDVNGFIEEADLAGTSANILIELSDLTRELLEAEARDKDVMYFETLPDEEE